MNRDVDAHDDRPSLTPKLLSCFQLIFPVSEETLIRGQREKERVKFTFYRTVPEKNGILVLAETNVCERGKLVDFRWAISYSISLRTRWRGWWWLDINNKIGNFSDCLEYEKMKGSFRNTYWVRWHSHPSLGDCFYINRNDNTITTTKWPQQLENEPNLDFEDPFFLLLVRLA